MARWLSVAAQTRFAKAQRLQYSHRKAAKHMPSFGRGGVRPAFLMSLALAARMLAVGDAAIQAPASKEPLTLARSIDLPHVEGRIDHLAFDASTQRLFVAALGNNTVEILDAKAGTHVKSLPGFREPQGIAVASDARVVAVANGQGVGLQM